MNQHSLNFVRGLFQSGLNEPQVKNVLLNAGFSPGDIDALIVESRMSVGQSESNTDAFPRSAYTMPPTPPFMSINPSLRQNSYPAPAAPQQPVMSSGNPIASSPPIVHAPPHQETDNRKQIIIAGAAIVFSLSGIGSGVWSSLKNKSLDDSLSPTKGTPAVNGNQARESTPQPESAVTTAPNQKTAVETYMDFKRTAQSARNASEFMAAYGKHLSSRAIGSESYQRDLSANPREFDAVFSFIKTLKLEPSADKMSVSEEKQDGNQTTLKLSGEGFSGEAVLVNENGFWKLDKESWTDPSGGTSSLSY